MNINDYSVEGLEALWDIVDAYFDFTGIDADDLENKNNTME